MRHASGWIVAVVAGMLLGGCGSESGKMERGDVVDREVATPQSAQEMGMTEKARRAEEQAEEESQESQDFEQSQE